jgi:hydroxyacylglutathione hydrolase
MAEIVSHRFVYRANVELVFADHVEQRTAQLHLDRLARSGAIVEVEPARWRVA